MNQSHPWKVDGKIYFEDIFRGTLLAGLVHDGPFFNGLKDWRVVLTGVGLCIAETSIFGRTPPNDVLSKRFVQTGKETLRLTAIVSVCKAVSGRKIFFSTPYQRLAYVAGYGAGIYLPVFGSLFALKEWVRYIKSRSGEDP